MAAEVLPVLWTLIHRTGNSILSGSSIHQQRLANRPLVGFQQRDKRTRNSPLAGLSLAGYGLTPLTARISLKTCSPTAG